MLSFSVSIARHAQRQLTACFVSLSFAGLVVLSRSLNPIPSRTRPLNSSAPMVLWLKPWESRSLPGLPRTKQFLFTCHDQTERRFPFGKAAFLFSRPEFWRDGCRRRPAKRGWIGRSVPNVTQRRLSGTRDPLIHRLAELSHLCARCRRSIGPTLVRRRGVT